MRNGLNCVDSKQVQVRPTHLSVSRCQGERQGALARHAHRPLEQYLPSNRVCASRCLPVLLCANGHLAASGYCEGVR
jgi:hypothetical protein